MRRVTAVHHRAAPFRKPTSQKAPATVDATINEVGVALSSIRVNHTGGPFGHAHYDDFEELRRAAIDPLIMNTVPYNNKNAKIIVPFKIGALFTTIVTLPSMLLQLEKRATCVPHDHATMPLLTSQLWQTARD